MIIAPSLLSADFSNLAGDVQRVENAGAEWLHLDVMDGAFVPNISFGAPIISAIRPHSKLYFDVHLMINDPIRYLDRFIKAGANMITVHLEACPDVQACLDVIHAAGLQAGIAISPETSVDDVLPYLQKCEMILVMTVHPGFGGQSFMAGMMPKVRKIRSEVDFLNLQDKVKIEVDGGINTKTAFFAANAGADVFVAGSFVFLADDPGAAIAALRESAVSD